MKGGDGEHFSLFLKTPVFHSSELGENEKEESGLKIWRGNFKFILTA